MYRKSSTLGLGLRLIHRLILCVAVLCCVCRAQGQELPAHRALIFGLGEQADKRWGTIHGDKDVWYVERMLRNMGYTDIQTLKNRQATKQAMVSAFKQLARRCRRGDHVYIHYSGHGQLMTDLDGDEAQKWNAQHAGWDESWIPYDAQMTYGEEDRGEKHLCDDEVARLLLHIRRRIGRNGTLIVVVDACHSGDATCGDADDECVRGVDVKFNIPRKAGQASARPVKEAWMTISACKPWQLSTELKSPTVGKLTYALYLLGASALQWNNQTLEEQLALKMSPYRGRLPQDPMVTGCK